MNPGSDVAAPKVTPFVDGAFSSSKSDITVEVSNPSNGLCVMEIPAGCDADVDRAVKSARRAFDEGAWCNASPSYRRRTLHRLADLLSAQAEELDALDAEEMGKPVKQSHANASEAGELISFYAEAINKVTGDVYNSDNRSLVVQRRVPRGVVAAVVPWNFPTFNAALKVAPALAAGNSVVLKPSELSSRSAMRIGQLAVEAGLPPGVLNVVPGLGETVGRALGLHMDVDMIAFTGSTTVGKQMLQYSGQSNMKVVMAECGGKAPHVVFADTPDLDAIATDVATMLTVNQGQICSVGSRLLVESSVEGALVEKIIPKLKGIVMGDACDARTTFGPLASAQQFVRVMRYIEEGRSGGATLVSGGVRGLPQSGGYFVEPTVFRNVAPTARIAQEEIFGPVLSIMTFDDEEEAIRIANGTVYGLIAYVWTRDVSRAMRLTKRIRSSLLINAAAPSGEGPGNAFSSEPANQSGVGIEGGVPGMESYMRRQTVWINHG